MSKPKPARLAESADALYQAVRDLEGKVFFSGRFRTPLCRVVMGGDYELRSGRLVRISKDGICAEPATRPDLEDFHDALEKDQIQVLVIHRFLGEVVDVRVLHSAGGNSFKS